jgi:hypothetical protein
VTLTLTDYAYFILVALGILIWLCAVALYVDKSLRERRYRKQARRRGGYVNLVFDDQWEPVRRPRFTGHSGRWANEAEIREAEQL